MSVKISNLVKNLLNRLLLYSMKTILTFALFLLFTSIFAQSTIRVQNGQNLQTAIDNATAGSTILVDGGSYGAVTLTKRITLIGAGAFVANPSIIPSIAFNNGSDNSALIGFKVTYNSSNAVLINNNVSNILIKSNYILGYLQTPSNSCTTNCNPINNLSIIHNVIYILVLNTYGSQISNCIIRNNIINQISGGNINFTFTGTIIFNTISAHYLQSSTYIFDQGYISCIGNNSSSRTIKNNIFIESAYNAGNYSSNYCPTSPSVVSFNAISDYLGAAYNSSNTISLNRNSLFVGFPTNVAGESLPFQFQLAPNSPARGVGENGVDCGAFGGSDPFPLSGTPTGPYIYELSAPSSVSSGQTLNVTVKARVSN